MVEEISGQDFTDDRLEIALDELSDDERWAGFDAAIETALARTNRTPDGGHFRFCREFVPQFVAKIR